jgi:hypothetical protein
MRSEMVLMGTSRQAVGHCISLFDVGL